MNYRFTTQSLPSTFVGFDRMFDEIDRLAQVAKKPSYPPYNTRKLDDDNIVIEIACAGFAKEDVDVSVDGNQLLIRGEMKSDPEAVYIHKGIAERDFLLSFTLPEHMVVKTASSYNGLLKVYLEFQIPESKKPRKITILEAATPDIKTVVDDTKKLAA